MRHPKPIKRISLNCQSQLGLNTVHIVRIVNKKTPCKKLILNGWEELRVGQFFFFKKRQIGRGKGLVKAFRWWVGNVPHLSPPQKKKKKKKKKTDGWRSITSRSDVTHPSFFFWHKMGVTLHSDKTCQSLSEKKNSSHSPCLGVRSPQNKPLCLEKASRRHEHSPASSAPGSLRIPPWGLCGRWSPSLSI